MKKLMYVLIAITLLLPSLVFAQYFPSYITLYPDKNQEYFLEFSNRQGAVYKFPYISNAKGFKYGDKDDDLVFIEGKYRENMTLYELQQTINAFNIGLNDSFALSDIRPSTNGWDENAISHIIRYIEIDNSDRTITFEDSWAGTKEFVYQKIAPTNTGALGTADLVFAGNTYKLYVGNVSNTNNLTAGDNPLAIDMDADGIINRSEIRLTTESGGILDLGNALASNGGFYMLIGWKPLWLNKGGGISGNNMDLKLLTKKGLIKGLPKKDESILTTIEKRLSNTIGIATMKGSNFNFKNPTGGVFFPGYDLKAELLSTSNTKADTARITYHPKTLMIQGATKIGSTVNITVAQNPGEDYVLGMALGDKPGYNLSDNRNIPLNDDYILYISLNRSNSIGLMNSQSKLDSKGYGYITWTIPNISVLVGLDVYLAFVSADRTKPLPGAIHYISPATKIKIA